MAVNYTFTTIDFPGAYNTRPLDINDAGQIVGSYIDDYGSVRGFLREVDGSYTTIEIDVPDVNLICARGVNDIGQIVGSYNDGGTEHGFLRNANGKYTIFDVRGAGVTRPCKINNAGQIVGIYGIPQYGFLLDNGSFITINFPNASWTYAGGINDAGQIVGYYSDDNDIWADGSFLLSGGRFNTINTYLAVDINNAGQVLGEFQLVFPGAVRTDATGINNTGQIVGYYDLQHGFLATPGKNKVLLVPSSETKQVEVCEDCNVAEEIWMGEDDYLFEQPIYPNTTPVITDICPNSVVASKERQLLTIKGAGFDPGLKVILRRIGGGTWYVPPKYTEVKEGIEITIKYKFRTTKLGSWTAQVVNPGNVESNKFDFIVSKLTYCGSEGCDNNGNYECFYARKIARLVEEKLRNKGHEVSIEYNQCAFLNSSEESVNGVGIIVHIHSNASKNHKARGTETFFESDVDKKLAKNVLENVVHMIESNSRGPTLRYQNHRLFFKHSSKIPTCLVEVLFHDNPCDMEILGSSDGQKNIAEGISEGIKAFLSQKDTLSETQ